MSSKIQDQTRRISELEGDGTLEGAPVTLAELMGEELVITDFQWRASHFRAGEQFVVVQVLRGGELYVFITGVKEIVRVFHKISPRDVPLRAKILHHRDRPVGERYELV